MEYCLELIQTITGVAGTIALIVTLYLMAKANDAAARTAEAAQSDLKLSHPPRFKITLPIIYLKGGTETKISDLPNFKPGERIESLAFAVNHGRYAAAITDSGCMLYWAKNGIIPMHLMYEQLGHRTGWASLPKGTVAPGDFVAWSKAETMVPEGFRLTTEEETHSLFMIGLIRYDGAASDRRGLYFCKRYLFDEQRFEDCPQYENED